MLAVKQVLQKDMVKHRRVYSEIQYQEDSRNMVGAQTWMVSKIKKFLLKRYQTIK